MNNQAKFRSDKFRRGIYILPNLFTTINMFLGFFAIVNTINHRFETAAIAIIGAGVFDMLDGKIARATNTTSKFGIEYDSLADLISFGMAPALLIYTWSLTSMGRIGWLAAFLYVACGALRLARFNTQTGKISSDMFVGLPIPGGAGMAATTVWFCYHMGVQDTVNPFLILIMLYSLAFLMVSTIKYNSFKKPELFNKINFNVFVLMVLILVLVISQPEITLFIVGVVYTLSGPLTSLTRMTKAKQLKAKALEKKEKIQPPV